MSTSLPALHPEDAARWLPVIVAAVAHGGRGWEVRCPDCGRPNPHGPEIGFHESDCHCEAMRTVRAFDGYVIAPPGAKLAPYPDHCTRCRNAGRWMKIYSPIDLDPSPDSQGIVALYSCDYSHEWTCYWGDRPGPPRPAFASAVRTALYRHYDKDDVLLYVGITNDLAKRGQAHARASIWAQFAFRTEAVWFDSRDEAEYEERRAIQVENPVFNVADALTPVEDRIASYMAALERRG